MAGTGEMDQISFLEKQFGRTVGGPQIRFGMPIWCHHHGSKMRVEKFGKENHTLVIAGSAAKVTITQASAIYPKAGGFFVDYEVVQYVSYDEVVRGRRQFSADDLAAAFGLSDESGKYGQWLIDQYGADSAEQGKYIRWKDYLNIPCPGTGHDGDPNVSIHLDQQIKDAVRQLLELE